MSDRPELRFFECQDCPEMLGCLFSNDYTDPQKWICPAGMFYAAPPFIFGLWPNNGMMQPVIIYCDPEVAQIDFGYPKTGEKAVDVTADIKWEGLKKPIKGYPFPF